jgi:hypothetical protein
MYIPSLFSTSPNGCPSGFNAYRMGNFGTTNLNTGLRGRITVTINQFTNDIVGENYQGLGSYSTDIQLANGASTSRDGIQPPSGISNPAQAFWGTTGQDQSINYFLTSSAGADLYYCYNCTQKWRYTIGSRLCSPSPPWPSLAAELELAVLKSPTGSITNASHYTITEFAFCTGTTGTIEGYGPIWQSGFNQAGYYIVSRENITPTKYTLQNCLTGVTASVLLSGSATLTNNTVIRAVGAGLTGSCWTVLNAFQNDLITPTYSNVVTSSTFVDCSFCVGKYNITDCDTSQSLVVTFSGNAPSIGSVIKSNTSGLADRCFTINSLASADAVVDYSNIITSATFADCAQCNASIDYLIVAGGGSGGSAALATCGGGGGAGGFIASAISIQSITGSYSVVVGNGASLVQINGGNSSVFSITATGGGRGGSGTTIPQGGAGSTGGSGGGATGASTTIISGSAGIVGQGFGGGSGRQITGNNQSAGGGGGASESGRNYVVGGSGGAGAGGSGSQWLDGNYYAGGGGGAYSGTGDKAGVGGVGGGGRGAAGGIADGVNGTTNTGGGGGGAIDATYTAGTGGSGIVKLRYQSGSVMGATGGTISVSGSYVYHTFTGSGTFTL